MRRRKGEESVFSLSALDLFASAMGAFMILALVMIPYYQKKSPEGLLAQVKELTAEQEALKSNRESLEAENSRLKAGAEQSQEEIDRLQKQLEDAENEKEESVYFSPVELVIAMDTSSSMKDSLTGLQADVENLLNVMSRISPRFRFGMVGYRGEIEEVRMRTILVPDQDGGRSIEAVVREVKGLSIEPQGALVDSGIERAIRMFSSTGGDVVQILILVGDAAPIEIEGTLAYEPEDEVHIRRAKSLVSDWISQNSNRRFSSIYIVPPLDSNWYTVPSEIARRELAEAFFKDIAERVGEKGSFSKNSSSMFVDILDAVLKR